MYPPIIKEVQEVSPAGRIGGGKHLSPIHKKAVQEKFS
jgi:hypothetical protein